MNHDPFRVRLDPRLLDRDRNPLPSVDCRSSFAPLCGLEAER